MTTSKLFTLTGSLLAFFEGRHLFLSYSTEGTKAFSPIVGGIGMLIGIFLLSTIVADFILAAHAMKGKLPYEWFIILPLGVLLFFFNMFAKNGGVLWVKGGVILMIAGLLLLLEGLQWTKKPSPTQLIALIGFSVGIFESIMQIASDFANVWAWITGILMFLLLALLFFATKVVKLPKKITPPMSWWFALCVAVTMYFFAINYQLSGVIIIHIFLLELIEL